MRRPFADLRAGGQALAEAVAQHRSYDPAPLVLGIARGAMPVAAEVAAALGAPLDALVADLELDRLWRGDRPAPVVAGRDVVVCDDGLATGTAMRAALGVLLEAPGLPRSILVALPVAPREGIEQVRALLRRGVDDVVAVSRPMLPRAVSWAYDDFTMPTDDDIRAILARPGGRPIA